MSITVDHRRDPAATETILRSLPSWFGIESGILQYALDAGDPAFRSYAAVRDDRVVGIALTRRHFPESAELHLLAVQADLRGTGIGTQLIDSVASELTADGARLLVVHTVGPSFPDPGYAQTRGFYRARGFLPVQELDGIDWGGPSLVLVRLLGRG